MPKNLPQRETTLALIFGASRWPDCPKFQEAPSFARSADELTKLLRDPSDLPFRNIKFLFDSFDDVSEQLRLAREFVERRRHEGEEEGRIISDLLLFYIGHGDFDGEAKNFYLSIRRTREETPLLTSITAHELGKWVRRTAHGLRSYLIVDCCFAAALQHGFMTTPLAVAELKLKAVLPDLPLSADDNEREIPASGVALLAAAGLNDPALAPPNWPYTAFTGALLEALHHGGETLPRYLSLSDLHSLIQRILPRRFSDAAMPELRPLLMPRGRIELVPLFRNAAFGDEPPPPSPPPPRLIPILRRRWGIVANLKLAGNRVPRKYVAVVVGTVTCLAVTVSFFRLAPNPVPRPIPGKQMIQNPQIDGRPVDICAGHDCSERGQLTAGTKVCMQYGLGRATKVGNISASGEARHWEGQQWGLRNTTNIFDWIECTDKVGTGSP